MLNNTPFKRGKIYKLKATGQKYRCLDFYIEKDTAAASLILRNEQTGWTITAHNVTLYADKSIEWSHSTGGYFDDKKVRVG